MVHIHNYSYTSHDCHYGNANSRRHLASVIEVPTSFKTVQDYRPHNVKHVVISQPCLGF